MNSFLADTGRKEVDRRLWLQTTNKMEAKADKTLKGQDKPVTVFNLNDFRDAQIDYPTSYAGLYQAKVKDKPTPDPHQIEAIEAVQSELQTLDRGHAYTSAIFASGDNAKIAKKIITQFDASGYLPSNILTPILKPTDFFPVGEYHQDYAMSEKKILTRRGFMSKANAYKFYRKSCGRDERIKKLWGNRGYFGVLKNK
tara:strand:- start:103 stop:696 length:594 start_codon:yes stop_codon:yes gene_type:complete